MSFLNSIPQTRFGCISPRATSRYRSLRSLRARLAARHFGTKHKNERRRPYAECARSANPQLSDCGIAFTLDSARAEQHILCCSSRAGLDRGGNAFLQSESVTASRGREPPWRPEAKANRYEKAPRTGLLPDYFARSSRAASSAASMPAASLPPA